MGPGLSPFQGPSPGSAHPIEQQPFERECEAMSDRVFSLMERHQQLDEALRLAQRRRAADPFEIARLKKLKLAIKDRIARLLRRPQLAG
jgi:uncharacterized protein